MKVSRFTPSLMKADDLEAIFVQRHELAAQIVTKIREAVLTTSKNNTLLIGSRGIGKTHLVSLVYHRIRNDDCNDRLLIAWLREEEWGVTSFLDLLLRIFRALKEEYGNLNLDVSSSRSGEIEGSKGRLADRVESLYELPPDAAESAGVGLLKEIIGDRTLLLLMENLDDLFEGLAKEGQKQFRSFLQKNACTILATAQSLFNSVQVKTSPFYGFFNIHHLEDLSVDEATQLLANIAKLDGKQELEQFIQTPTGRDRIKAVHHLAGGNPRIYVIFSEFLTRESLDELIKPFERTLDDLTPYYQSRMAWLSPQQRKIVEFLCDRRQAVTVKEIAQRCFMTHQTASSQLKKLLEMGYVRSEAIGRESYYELRETLMRFCLEVKKQRGEPIRLFVDFLRIWYTTKELESHLELLPSDAFIEREYLLQALQTVKEESEDPRLIAYLNEYKFYFEKKDYIHALQMAENFLAIFNHARGYCLKGMCLFLLGRYEETLASFNKWIELDSKDALAWYHQSQVLFILDYFDEALISNQKAIELNSNNANNWSARGIIMIGIERFNDAFICLQKAIEIDSNNTNNNLTQISLGLVFLYTKRYGEALPYFEKAINLEPNFAFAWLSRGLALTLMGSYKEALVSLEKAINLGDKYPWAFFRRAEALLALNRWDEGITALDNTLQNFAHTDDPETGYAKPIISNLFNSTNDTTIWRSHIFTLVKLYQKHQVLSVLGKGLFGNIPALMSEMVSDKAAQIWLELWRELTSEYKEFQIPLRLLNAAVEYKVRKGDRRVLMELAIEERQLLEPLLGAIEPINMKVK